MDVPYDYEGPPTATVCCPKCGCEATITIHIHPGVGGPNPPEPGWWTGRCPECREDLCSDDLDECDGCHVRGRKLYHSINVNAVVCGECKVEEIEAAFA